MAGALLASSKALALGAMLLDSSTTSHRLHARCLGLRGSGFVSFRLPALVCQNLQPNIKDRGLFSGLLSLLYRWCLAEAILTAIGNLCNSHPKLKPFLLHHRRVVMACSIMCGSGKNCKFHSPLRPSLHGRCPALPVSSSSVPCTHLFSRMRAS